MTKIKFRHYRVVSGETISVSVTAISTPYAVTFSDICNPPWTIKQIASAEVPAEIREFVIPAALPGGDSFTLILTFQTLNNAAPDAKAAYRIAIVGDPAETTLREKLTSDGLFQVSASYSFSI